MIDEPQAAPRPKHFQFSLGLLMGAALYSAALATLSVNLAGKTWNPFQVAAAYFVTIGCVVGFAVISKARGKIAAYLLLSPLVFVAAVVAAAMFHSERAAPAINPVTVAITTPGTTPATTPAPTNAPVNSYKPQPPQSPGSATPLGH